MKACLLKGHKPRVDPGLLGLGLDAPFRSFLFMRDDTEDGFNSLKTKEIQVAVKEVLGFSFFLPLEGSIHTQRQQHCNARSLQTVLTETSRAHETPCNVL